MAVPTRHFKIGFSGYQIMKSIKDKREISDIMGLFNFVLRGMKFSYDYVFDETETRRLDNGTWTGTLGLLNRSEIDYAPDATSATYGTWEAAAYNYPYSALELTFVTRKPEYSPQMMDLFRTLSLNVWLSLLACIILVTLACFVAMKHRYTLDDILLHVFAIGLNQEGNLVPKRAGEVLLLSTWLGAMAVFTLCFKSVLLSFLTFPPLGGVRNIPELAAAIRAGTHYAYTIPRNNFPIFLQNSTNEDWRVIGDSILKSNRGFVFALFNKSPKDPIRVCVYYRDYLSFLDEKMYVSKDSMMSFSVGTMVSKDFCCKDEMDMLVLRYAAAGIKEKINRFGTYENTFHLYSYMPDDGETTRKLTMTDLSGAFIILVAGHCLSICILIIECCVKRREKRRSLPFKGHT